MLHFINVWDLKKKKIYSASSYLWQAVLAFIHFQDSWYQQSLFFYINNHIFDIKNVILYINKSEMSPCAIQNQLLISRIDFLLVEIPISHIRNTNYY